jgi:hypothetical protein
MPDKALEAVKTSQKQQDKKGKSILKFKKERIF